MKTADKREGEKQERKELIEKLREVLQAIPAENREQHRERELAQ